ncbi:alpha-tocopherol transfer protein-like [Chironomus tepperi]|uniref:alpha-tocopherol transfer protein-like n=1 Tax=Chironomus tepperi TaxID=113505 RepID=UPI00391F901D
MSNKISKDDNRSLQSLELFRNWLAKHSFLKYTGNDNIDDLLMFFLRVKKFSMQKAYDSFEFTIRFIKSHPDWYLNPGPADYDYTHKPNSPLTFLKNVDSKGRRVAIYRMKNVDNFDHVEFFRRMFMTPLLFYFDIDAQINGVVLVVDFSEASMGKMRKVPVQLVYDAFQFSKYDVMRLQQINVIGMPSFFMPIYELAKKLTSSKIIQRFNFINDKKELSKHMDVSGLPIEYGGKADELLDFAAFESGIEILNKIHKFNVNLSKIHEHENVGSFRKLEID